LKTDLKITLELTGYAWSYKILLKPSMAGRERVI
jgi:hypothetical protein